MDPELQQRLWKDLTPEQRENYARDYWLTYDAMEQIVKKIGTLKERRKTSADTEQFETRNFLEGTLRTNTKQSMRETITQFFNIFNVIEEVCNKGKAH